MQLLITLALALAPRAHANGRLARYARNSTSHPGRCDRNVFEREFYNLAKGLEPTSDKVTAHSYETMYGTFVYPLKFAAHTPRMLEIGLGCNMDYGPGASVQIWRQLLPHAELWEAEYDAECVEKARAKGQLEGIKTVTGDQHTKGRGFKHKIPDDVSFVYCQLEACVIGKRNRHVEGSRPGLPGHDFPGRR